ncbi:MAG: PqqD family protein [Bacteroidales bacterium]|nr:PqqD family protein [Bacteroidales bacterium]
MKINTKYKVRQVAGENIVLVQGRNPGDMTSVVAFNDSSLYLWNSLLDKDFEMEDVVSLLTERYEVDEAVAAKDAESWIKTLQEKGLLV